MRLTKTLILTLLATSAVSVTASAPAFAVIEGPTFEVGGARLLEKEEKNIINLKKATSTGNIEFSIQEHAAVRCSSVSIVSTSPHRIIGSTGANAGTSKETLAFSGCSVVENGEPCAVKGGGFTTKPLVDTLGYSEATPKKGTKIMTLFKPESGSELAVVEFEGSGCVFDSIVVKGNIFAEVFVAKAVEKVEEETAAPGKKVGEVNFSNQASIWVEASGTLTRVTHELMVSGVPTEAFGRIELELEGTPNWRVFT